MLNVIVCRVNKRLVNGFVFEGTLPCKSYRTVARVYLSYLHFKTQILHIPTMEDEKVARKCVQEFSYHEGCGYTNERTYLESQRYAR